MDNVSGATVEDLGVDQHLVDLPCGSGVELAEHHRGVTQYFGEFRGTTRTKIATARSQGVGLLQGRSGVSR